MPKSAHKSLEDANRELDEHFAREAEKKGPDSLKAVQFDVHQIGALALIKLPYRSDTVEFGIACRSIKQVADMSRVNVLFFDSRQQYESFRGDNDLALARFGLQRIPKP